MQKVETKNNKSVFLVIGLIILVIGGFIWSSYSSKPKTESNTNKLVVENNDWVWGRENAKVTIIEYLDFECEACGQFYPVIEQIKKDYPEDVKYIVRYFPLDGHKNSRTSAYAAEAAGKQGKFWEMYNLLFTNQKDWGEQSITNQDQFEKYAIEIGLDIEKWRQDVKSKDVVDRVNKNYREAISSKFQGTPTFFFNGEKINNPRNYEDFKQLIENRLSK